MQTLEINPILGMDGTIFSLLIGSMLGDGYLRPTHSTKKAEFVEVHAMDQEDYCLWKRNLWEKAGYPVTKPSYTKARKETHQDTVGFRIGRRKEFYPWWEAFYSHQIKSEGGLVLKRIPKGIEHYITPLALAIWYMDDGGVSGGVPFIAGMEPEKTVCILDQFGLKTRVGDKDGAPGTVFIGGYSDGLLFKAILEPHIHPNLQYKLDGIRQSNSVVEADLAPYVTSKKTQIGVRDGWPVYAACPPTKQIPKNILLTAIKAHPNIKILEQRFGVSRSVIYKEMKRHGVDPTPFQNQKNIDPLSSIPVDVVWHTLVECKTLSSCLRKLEETYDFYNSGVAILINYLKKHGRYEDWVKHPENLGQKIRENLDNNKPHLYGMGEKRPLTGGLTIKQV